MEINSYQQQKVQKMLTEMRELQNSAKISQTDDGMEDFSSQKVQFSDFLKNAIGNVNNQMVSADSLKDAYEYGDKGVSIAQVMVQSQKSNIYFQSLLQVRNKLLSAYHEVMNMQV